MDARAAVGLRLVFWPDVAEQANKALDRRVAAAEDRCRRADQESKWRKAVARGEDPAAVAKRLGFSKQRLERLLDSMAA